MWKAKVKPVKQKSTGKASEVDSRRKAKVKDPFGHVQMIQLKRETPKTSIVRHHHLS
jgi:hypothetical protein